MTRLACAPLTRAWPKPETAAHARHAPPFTVSYDAVFRDLLRELGHLSARDALLECDMRPERFRKLDTWPYADGPVISPKVCLSFQQGDLGEMLYACDRYRTWLGNVRAISLTLTALRAVDRYGATGRGEQYRGFRRLGSGNTSNGGPPEPMTREEAARLVMDLDPGFAHLTPQQRAALADSMLSIPAVGRAFVMDAMKRAHPDAGGDTARFQRISAARDILFPKEREG